MDAVLHFGAVPSPAAPFEQILSSNIAGTQNVLEACRQTGIRRLVYASSIMTDWGYFTFQEPYKAIREVRLDEVTHPIRRITHLDPTWPTEHYSASKVWGEGICHAYSDTHELSVICLRIGAVTKENYPTAARLDSVYCSHIDIVTISRLALEATESHRFDICYAVSESTNRWVDLDHSREILGFTPATRAEDAALRAGRP